MDFHSSKPKILFPKFISLADKNRKIWMGLWESSAIKFTKWYHHLEARCHCNAKWEKPCKQTKFHNQAEPKVGTCCSCLENWLRGLPRKRTRKGDTVLEDLTQVNEVYGSFVSHFFFVKNKFCVFAIVQHQKRNFQRKAGAFAGSLLATVSLVFATNKRFWVSCVYRTWSVAGYTMCQTINTKPPKLLTKFSVGTARILFF